MARPLALPNREAIRKATGTRGKFTLDQLAEGADVSANTARSTLQRMIESGEVELVGTQKHTDEDGNVTAGRPAKVYRTVSGASA